MTPTIRVRSGNLTVQTDFPGRSLWSLENAIPATEEDVETTRRLLRGRGQPIATFIFPKQKIFSGRVAMTGITPEGQMLFFSGAEYQEGKLKRKRR